MNRVPIGILLITHLRRAIRSSWFPSSAIFICGQDERLRDKAAVRCATDGATRWMPTGGWRNVLIEADNE